MNLLGAAERVEFENLIREIQKVENINEFEDFVLHQIPPFIGSNFASWNKHDDEMRLTRVTSSRSYKARVDKLLGNLRASLPTHPLFHKYIDLESGKSRYVDTVDRTRSVVSDEEYRQLPFYHQVASVLEIEDQLIMHVYVKNGHGIVLTYHSPRLFNEAEHLKASILRGHLVARLYGIDLAKAKREILRKDLDEHLKKRITPREMIILRSICQGLGNYEISEHLGISKRTVDHHVSNVLRKLSAGSRVQLIARFGSWIDEA
jgi:DNA-binding CsgD family transcriptional regulator